ncbi:hypothetical protein NM208_g1547 [Fusarium decemcellulare]|uniref:Uncharacterized protein n=1 Tax=Fusarium decemcellulare TaxID=57161 RepID=A0ACC1SVT6_9HYPO|nr:hypothetical protein NM208_g1547 [Fusarium decemcellulare]
MYTSARRDSCLKQAVLATAFIALSRRYKSSALYLTARTHYGAALRAVNLTLFSPSTIRQEETLASLMLLGMIEDIDHHGPSAKSTHMLGIAKLCEVVGRRPLTRIEESSLDEWMFKELELHSLVAGDYLDCLAIPNTSLDGKKPVTRVAVTVARIGQFCRDFKNSRPLQESALEAKHLETLISIVEQATVVQHELSEIDSSVLPEWNHQNTTDERHADERGSQLPVHPSRWIATARSLFHVSSILFFTKFVSCCRTLLELDQGTAYAYHPRHETKTSLTLAEAQLVRLIHMLCATMPYLMGEVDEQGNSVAVPVHKAVIMYHLIWPLAFVNASAWSTRQQVQDARRRLDLIQEQYGIKLASAAPEMARSILD